jgi:hypothetical protein
VENAESAGRSRERELVDRVRARGLQSVEVFGRMWRRGCASMIRVRKGGESMCDGKSVRSARSRNT